MIGRQFTGLQAGKITIVIWEFYLKKKIKKIRKKYGHIITNCPLAEDNREFIFRDRISCNLTVIPPSDESAECDKMTKPRNKKKKGGKNVISVRGSKDLGNIFAQANLVVYYFSENQGKMRKWKRLRVVEAETGRKKKHRKVHVVVKTQDYGLFADFLTFLTIFLAINTPERGQNMRRPFLFYPSLEKDRSCPLLLRNRCPWRNHPPRKLWSRHADFKRCISEDTSENFHRR